MKQKKLQLGFFRWRSYPLGNKTRSRKTKNGKTVGGGMKGSRWGEGKEGGEARLPRFRDGIFKRNRSRETAARFLLVHCVTENARPQNILRVYKQTYLRPEWVPLACSPVSDRNRVSQFRESLVSNFRIKNFSFSFFFFFFLEKCFTTWLKIYVLLHFRNREK